jgi:hypothetical protein
LAFTVGRAFEVFALLDAREGFIFPGDPLFAFSSPPESDHSDAAGCRDRDPRGSSCLPCGFFPFGVFPELGSHITPEIPLIRVEVPPQRFSRSRGLDPPSTCRPCFMPVPPMGFRPSGMISTCGAVPSLEGRYPLAVDPWIPLQGLAPRKCPCFRRAEAAPLLGFCLLRGFTLVRRGLGVRLS